MVCCVGSIARSRSRLNEDMGGLGRPVARPPYGAGHSLDKAVALAQLLELLRGQLQPRTLDQNGEALW